VERLLLAAEDDEPQADARVYIALARPDAVGDAFALARRLRDEGVRVEIEQAGRSMKGQLKQADRIGARATVILGDGIEVKDMDSGEQRAAESLDDAAAKVGEVLER
jgi:histidyl-tRNA synthetase